MNIELAGSGFPVTKTGIKSYSEKVLNDVLDGYANPLEMKVKLSAMKLAIEAIEKNEEFKEACITEANKYHKDELKDLYNSSIQVKESGVNWDYSICNHPAYDRMTEEITRLTEKSKSFEKYLQTVTEETPFIDPETGEQTIINPPIRTSTTVVAITINK